MPPTLKQLAYRHAEHKQFCDHWSLLDAVVRGGKAITQDVKLKLLANPDGRPANVMAERAKLASYCNKIGPILTRFNSQLFAESFSFNGSSDPFWDKTFSAQGALLDNDDDARASLKAFLSQAMFNALKEGKAIAQIDTRITDENNVNRKNQQESGELDPYLVLLPRSALWDWDAGATGFNFTKLHRFRLVRQSWDQPPVPEHDFTIYQRNPEDGSIRASRYLVRKRLKDSERANPPTKPLDLDSLKDEEVEIETKLENKPIFNLRGQYKFPVVTLTLPDTLWMADQLLECQRSYFSQTAALEWALYSTNFSMPFITGVESEEDDPVTDQKFGDGYYLTLKPGQSIGWTERPGGAFGTAMTYRAEVKRDIYDVLQQIAMSAADGAAIIARSGESKKEDRRPEQILMEGYGHLIRDFLKQNLEVAAIVRSEQVQWEIRGFDDYLGEGLVEDLADYQGVKAAQVPSETFMKATTKHFVKQVGKAMDLDGKDIEKSLAEVESAKQQDFQPQQEEGAGQPMAA